jgi:type II secretory pathway pseudopilin PulG
MLLNKIHLKLLQEQAKHGTVQGFMLVEVLVGLLLTLILTGIAMQVVVMATAVKVRGDEVTDANSWIQADLEDIKRKAIALDYVTASTKYTPTLCGTRTSTNGYGAALNDQPSNGSTTIKISSTADIAKSSTTGTRSYILKRTATVKDAAPFNVLKISYGVYRASDTSYASPILTAYADVIPSASFYCKTPN